MKIVEIMQFLNLIRLSEVTKLVLTSVHLRKYKAVLLTKVESREVWRRNYLFVKSQFQGSKRILKPLVEAFGCVF